MKEYKLLIGKRGYSICLYVDGVLRTYVQYHTDLLYALRETWKLNILNHEL